MSATKAATKAGIGSRIATARRRRGISQEGLAESIGLNKTAISRIESGQRKVDSYELALIAETLGASVRDLLDMKSGTSLLEVAARVAETASDSDLSQSVRRIRQLVETEHLLDEIGVPDSGPRKTFNFDLPATSNPRTAGRSLAEQVRKTLNAGNGPIVDLPDFIEKQFGVDVALEPLGDGVSGLCVRSGKVALILVNSSTILGHQRFTLAHELCHQLFGDPHPVVVERDLADPATPEEERANTFAAYFLMPPEGIKDYLGDRALSDGAIVDLAFVFGVSVPALTWHLHELKMITWDQAVEVRRSGVRGLAVRHGRFDSWAVAESQRDVVRPPKRLFERTIEAYVGGRIGIGPLAGLLQVEDEEQLRRDLANEGIQPKLSQDVDVAQLV